MGGLSVANIMSKPLAWMDDAGLMDFAFGLNNLLFSCLEKISYQSKMLLCRALDQYFQKNYWTSIQCMLHVQ